MRIMLLSAIALTLTSAHVAHAATVKIAYVDMTRALNEVSDGKTAKAKLKKEFEHKQKKLDEMQQNIKKKKDTFEQRKAMMKPDVRLQKQDELQRELMQLQQTYMQLQQELMANETQITQTINKKLRKVIAKIGDRDGYMVILNIGETVLYHKRHQDVTDVVVKEYNATYGKK